MEIGYFRHREIFNFVSNPYDIGNPIGFWHKYEDNHFLKKLYKINDDEFDVFYKYHLSHSLEHNVCTEEDFFIKVWEIVNDRVRNLKAKDPYSASHDRYVLWIGKLQQFQKYLNSVDKWNARPSHVVIAEKEAIIQKQKQEIETLEARWEKVKGYEVSQKIWIKQGYLPTVIDLFKQIEKLEVPSGGSLLKYDHQVAYPRMISKYFAHAGNDIPVETLRNYYVVKKDDVPVKGTSIQSEHKLFEIIPLKETKK
ncbi:hypothetical protein QG516_06910 [Pedobacter gandavensis]|uniref:hypothetical protein n=1 Tax=Pedobacter gandavensis TaxID=2679963 RepID=UPI0024798631|nr:hypothetical protein [Pedobacter gandavensis]WGQ11381.1 hypothetical protein QG516_06910 [Pedobacter gandavensis]